MKFPHPWFQAYDGYGPLPLLSAEWDIIEISKAIRSKPEWKSKYKNDEITAKWESELCSQSKRKEIKELFNYVLQELDWYVEMENSIPGYTIECDDKIVTSDTVIPKEIKGQLVKEVKSFASSLKEKDYHPGSNNQVLDLVHPSLYPYQYGKTPTRTDNGIELVPYSDEIKNVKPGVSQYFVSKKYQWLPSLLVLDGDKYSIKSYINNLVPDFKYKELYTTIETIFNLSLEGLSHVLARTVSEQVVRIPTLKYDEGYTDEFNERLKDAWRNLTKMEDAEWTKMFEEIEQSKVDNIKPLSIEYRKPETSKFDLKEFQELKVIVKLADIELTPENPKYKGGSWHVEGTINEDIVATILYYYDSENISESKLSFRTTFEEPEYEQGDDFFCEHFYGLKDESPLCRNLGSVECKEDRLLIFPNVFQHHVDPFELVDKSKRGHRKILCMFLVDPNNNLVVTTEKVPVQQPEWQELNDEVIIKKITDLNLDSDWPPTLEEMKRVREDLMKERSANPNAYDDEVIPFERLFSLCEH
ncbi:hypothetical protein CLIB1444_11S00606 [[Candida] jaroonii]|uniref:Uncharacterized protein n=1 Tax=[Candida] jaroonii TaxID=467808 RepID=A0ACA9YCG9_9ASCO|nr:hypothetical protein CLIB1444_11S00606 [[Candida] jaroonii]